MKGFCALGSGSSGNALFLGTERTRVLIDVGLSFRALKERLGAIGVDIETIDAVLITHEHTDHIRGLSMIVKKLGIPVFCNSETAKAILRGGKFQTGSSSRANSGKAEVSPRFKVFFDRGVFYVWRFGGFSV